ncbi:hypothetical protein ILYODFUR_031228 [Ilyodon furcidens]|uniref:Secreted protein n=1 Tax=Ilyodon furcidens TaxID=33524 RepID=A0ABV0TZM9_9TELE
MCLSLFVSAESLHTIWLLSSCFVVQVDPEDNVSYASISYTKKSTSNSRIKSDDDDDDGDAVTYSTLKASSTDPSSL